jgi:hypothetical protein
MLKVTLDDPWICRAEFDIAAIAPVPLAVMIDAGITNCG